MPTNEYIYTMLRQKLNNIIAIAVGILPIYTILIWYRLTHEKVFTLSDMLVYPLIFGGGNILLILALNKYLLKQKINDLNSGISKWYWDILVGFVLSVIYFIFMSVERVTIARVLP